MKANTLSKAILFSASILTSNLTFGSNEISSTKQDVGQIINNLDIEKYQTSLDRIGQTELNFFKSYFNLNTEIDFNQKVKEIQKTYSLKQDGIMGAQTLKTIYLNIYAKDENITDENILKRLAVYNDLLGYQDNSKALYLSLDVFKKMTYFGEGVGENIPGTYINEKVSSLVPSEIPQKINIIKTGILNGKHIALFFVQGKLYVATYISPGIPGKESSTIFGIGNRDLDKLHISASYPEYKKNVTDEYGFSKEIVYKAGGAVMPYAVNITGSEYLHGSPEKIDGNPQSHGCSRTPLFYIYEIYKKVNELGKDNVTIDTTSMYTELSFESEFRYANNKK